MAREAADTFHLDRVLFVPAAQPPHKPESTGASFEDRYQMVELACNGSLDGRFEPSRLEAAEEKSYSVVTLRKVRPLVQDLFFIIGADAFAEITSWYQWQELLRLTEFIVVTRPGHEYRCPPGAKVHRLDTLALPVSSSEIRQHLASGRVPTELPTQVADYIVRSGLYHYRQAAGSTNTGS